MKKINFFFIMPIIAMAICLNSCSKKEFKQIYGVLWYLPTMTLEQANNLKNYDLIVIDYENFINNPESVNQLKMQNNKIKIILYLNQTEIFEPMWNDKPWSIKLLEELNKRPEWWLRQPDGSKLGAWTNMYALDMRDNCPLIKGERYWQFIAKKFLNILRDKKIDGCLIDNCWGDDPVGIGWLATYRGQNGFDFNRDGQPDDDLDKISRNWTSGMKNYIRSIRKEKGENFIIIANPGNDSYQEVDGKQFETFPYPYHNLKGGNNWEINMRIAAGYKIALINPDPDNYWIGLCSSVMLDNCIFVNSQNTQYSEEYDLKLGKPLGAMKKISNNTYARKFDNGQVYIKDGQTAWIKYSDGSVRK